MSIADFDEEVTTLQWKIGPEKNILETPIFRVTVFPTVNERTGAEGDFYRLHCPEWVNILALTAKRELVMIRQFRHGTRCVELEIPAGIIESGESPLEAAVRELREETGYAPIEPGKIIAEVYPNPAFQSNRCYYVLFEDVRKTQDSEPEALESILTFTRPFNDVLQSVLAGDMRHALMAHAVLHYAATCSKKL